MNKFDKPYRIPPSYDAKKYLELFTLASKLDTHEILQFSLINMIPLDVTNENEECLIHEVISIDPRISSQHAKLNVIKFLVQNNVNPDKPNKFNKTPLHIACSLQLEHIIEYLLSIGVNPNYADNSGFTPFHYLLTGHIKTIDRTTEIIDFIPPAKNKDVENIKKMVHIKTKIWELIQNLQDKIPLLSTLKFTLKHILEEDTDIVSKQSKILKLITELATKKDSVNIALKVKEEINASRQLIKDHILKHFNRMAKLDNFQILNTKDDLSWSPYDNKTLIRNGNIKRVIKKDLKDYVKEISKINSDFESKVINLNKSGNFQEVGFNDMMNEYYKILSPHLKKHTFGRNKEDYITYMDGNFFDPAINMKFIEVNMKIKHALAYDNASSIIDFNNLKYVGGPRNITISRMSRERDSIDVIFTQFLGANLNSDYKKVLFMLDTPLLAHIETLGQNGDIFELLKNNLLFNVGTMTFSDNTIEQDFAHAVNLLDFDARQINHNNAIYPMIMLLLKYFIIFVSTAIHHSDKFSELHMLLNIDNINVDIVQFLEKWMNSYMVTNIGSWILGMWCDIMCLYSNSNLECNVSPKFLLLIAALNTKHTNKTKAIINTFKPQLISYIMPADDTTPSFISKWFMMLLNNNIDINFYTSMKNVINIGMITTLTTNNMLNILCSLIFKYISLKNGVVMDDTYERVLDSNEQALYTKFKADDKPIDVICKIIIDMYNNMDDKPMKQTIIDSIYFLRNYDTNNDVLNFLNISTEIVEGVDIVGGFMSNLIINKTDMKKNMQPSRYSILNYIYDGGIHNDDPFNIMMNHLKISHYLGLYYEGILPEIQIDNLTNGMTENIQDKLKLSASDVDNIDDFHIFNGNILENNNIPLPLNFLLLNDDMIIPDVMKGTFYNIGSENGVRRYYCIPTYTSYSMFCARKIKSYQERLVNNLLTINKILDDFIKGDTKRLKQLFLSLYTEVILYTKMIAYFINNLQSLPRNTLSDIYKNPTNYSYKKLGEILNKVNSIFYLYYYLFSQDKLIKLSKFNYFQLPIENAEPFLYFNKDNSELPNIMNDKIILENTQKSGDNELNINDNMYISGHINKFSIGNYNNILKEYISGNNVTQLVQFGNMIEFSRLKDSKLPPSLYNSLDTFYKYSLIEIIKNIINHIHADKTSALNKEIYDKINELTGNTILTSTVDNDMIIYNIICVFVEELIKEQINVYIDNAVLHYYNIFYNKQLRAIDPTHIIDTLIMPTDDIKVNLEKTTVTIPQNMQMEYVRNFYSPVTKLSTEHKPFILYPNDLTNMNKLKIKYGLNINMTAIKILLDSNASPFIHNNDGNSAIYPIIKNYNYKLVSILKKEGVDFRFFDKLSPIHFIKTENINNINKILGDKANINNINKLLSNIDGNLYADIKAKIVSNEIFGNNVLLYLQESFNICSYITLQYLSEYLLNTNNNFTIMDASDIFSMIGMNLDINKNYLGENLKSFKIPNNFNVLIAKQLYSERDDEYNNVLSKLKTYDDNISELEKDTTNKTKMNLADMIRKSKDYIKMNTMKDILEKDRTNLKQFIDKEESKTLDNNSSTDINIMTRYNRLHESSYDMIGLIIYGWNKLLSDPSQLNSSNYNMIPVYLLEKQRVFILSIDNKTNVTTMTDLFKINKAMEHLATFAEKYFETNKYTDENEFLVFMNELLIYITKLVIGNGIELMMRRILLSYFTSSSMDLDSANAKINIILNTKYSGKSESMLEILYNNICPILVKNSVEIFANRAAEQGHYNEPINEILSTYFQNLESESGISSVIHEIFRKDVVTYFDTFTSKTILLWYVNIENILKFYINNYRCVETLKQLL